MFSFKRLVKFGLISCFLLVLALIIAYFSIKDSLPSVESLKNVQWQTPMKIFTVDGQLISQYGEKKRMPLPLEEFPQPLINAILATEDDRFYLHFGVDPIGMARAVIGQITGSSRGGASTITMQVARNFFGSREITYIRKLREIFTAFHIEYLLTKDEILSLYLNKIPLGHRAFGFGAAAQVYYGKELHELTLPQFAVLAGLPKAPSTINPIRSPKRAKARRAVVLKRMLVSNYISEEEYTTALNAPITGKRHGAEIELDAPYIAEMAHQEMISLYGKEQAYTGGYRVFTTVPAHLQKTAQQAVISNLFSYDQRHGYRGPITSLRPELNGENTAGIATNSSANIQVEDGVDSSGFLPLTSDEVNAAVAELSGYQNLIPAVVSEVFDNEVTIKLINNMDGIIPWQGMSWAREFISDQKQGLPPKLASDILSFGDVIWVTKNNIDDNSYHLNQLPQVSSALVAISPDNGAIKAVVGGFSFKQSQFNRVTQAKRQVGSNIKPFIYSAALENGFTLASMVNDAPINQADTSTGFVWRPENSPPIYIGPIRVRRALAESKNVIAVRLLRSVGLRKIIDHLSSFGFAPDELPRDESLALGSASLTPLEVVTGFATFANGGFLIDPYLIDRIEDSLGNVIFQAEPLLACDDCKNLSQIDDFQSQTDLEFQKNLTAGINPLSSDSISGEFETINTSRDNSEDYANEFIVNRAERVISPQNAFLITEALNSAIWGFDRSVNPNWRGTGFRARALNRTDIAGKTGTTNEAKDAWFSGFSRRLVATSWIGFDNPSRNLGQSRSNANLGKNQITGKEFGAKSAQPAWITFMNTALAELPIEPFEQPLDIVSVRIDKVSGKLSKKTDKTSLFEYFQIGTPPTEYVTFDNSGEILDGDDSTEDEDIF